MTDDVERFFHDLDQRGSDPVLAKTTGRVGFELVDGQRTDRWTVSITRGEMTVAHKGGAADCTVRTDRAWCERLFRGEENAIAGVLRGLLTVAGDVELLFAIQRIFPGPRRDRSVQVKRSESR